MPLCAVNLMHRALKDKRVPYVRKCLSDGCKSSFGWPPCQPGCSFYIGLKEDFRCTDVLSVRQTKENQKRKAQVLLLSIGSLNHIVARSVGQPEN